MSGICGFVNRDNRSIDLSILRRMQGAALHRGPDGIDSWHVQNVALSQMLMATTPEAVRETKPFFHPSSNSCIVFDGRLDNRTELISQLIEVSVVGSDITDMELALLAWLKWGTQCAEKLLGDFAFALFDGVNRRLFCARDIASIKPFYYSIKPGQFIFASTISQMLAHPLVSSQENEGMIAEVLSWKISSGTDTIYKDILRLPGAHYLVVDEHSFHIRRYWTIPLQNRLAYSSFGEYSEHFEEVFALSVGCRLRSNGTVATTLSGGKDSPSVAGMAQLLLRKAGADKPLKSFSTTYPGRLCDESDLIKDVVAKWQLDAHYYPFITFDQSPDWARQVELSRELPDFPPFSALSDAQRYSAQCGTRVWLSGVGSDTLFGGTSFPFRGMLRDRKFRKMLKEFSFQKNNSGLKFASKHALASILWPFLPTSLKRNIEHRKFSFSRTGFLTQEFIKTSDLEARVRAELCADQFDELSQWASYCSGFSGLRAFCNEEFDRSNAFNGIEERHPFQDRRMIEFGFSIPDYINRDTETGKLLLLELGKKLLPESVRLNTVKTEVGCVLLDAMFKNDAREVFESLKIAQRGWVSNDETMAVYERLYKQFKTDPNAHFTSYNMSDYGNILRLWMVFSVELWLRSFERPLC